MSVLTVVFAVVCLMSAASYAAETVDPAVGAAIDVQQGLKADESLGGKVDGGLQQLFQIALRQNPRLAGANEVVNAALNEQQIAQSFEKPALNFTSELSYAWMQRSDFSRTANQLRASYPLYQPDKADLSAVASFKHSATQLQLAAETQDVLLSVASLYFQYWSQEAQVTFLQKEQRSIASIMAQVQQRFQLGYQDLNDIAEIESRLDMNQAELLQAEQNRFITQSNLEALLGFEYGLESGSKLDLSQFVPPEQLPEKIVVNESDQAWSDRVKHHPSVKRLQQMQLAKIQTISYEQHKDGPSVEVFGAYVYNDSGARFYDDMQGVRAGVQLKLPLYLGGRTDASVAKARAGSNQLQAQQRQLELRLQAQIKNAYASYQSGLKRLQALKSALVSNQQALKATENGLKTGSRNILDLLAAQRNLHRAQRDIPMTELMIWKNWTQFYWSLGQLQSAF